MMTDDENDIEFVNKYIKLAARMSNLLKSKKGELLIAVKIKGEGKGYYWSISDRAFVLIERSADFYWVDKMAKDKKGRLCLFTPYTFGMGNIVLVPEKEIEWLGYN
jgi:hypothetical protein